MCTQINLEVEINFITLRKTWFATAAQGKPMISIFVFEHLTSYNLK